MSTLANLDIPWNRGGSASVARERREIGMAIDRRIGPSLGRPFSFSIHLDEYGSGDRTLMVEFDAGRMRWEDVAFVWGVVKEKWNDWRVILGDCVGFHLVIAKDLWAYNMIEGSEIAELREIHARRVQEVCSCDRARIRVRRAMHVEVIARLNLQVVGSKFVLIVGFAHSAHPESDSVQGGFGVGCRSLWFGYEVQSAAELLEFDETYEFAWDESAGREFMATTDIWVMRNGCMVPDTCIDADIDCPEVIVFEVVVPRGIDRIEILKNTARHLTFEGWSGTLVQLSRSLGESGGKDGADL